MGLFFIEVNTQTQGENFTGSYFWFIIIVIIIIY